MIQYLFLFFFFILSFLSLSVCDVETRWEKWSKTQPAVYIVANNNSNNNIYISRRGGGGGIIKKLKSQPANSWSIHPFLSLSLSGWICVLAHPAARWTLYRPLHQTTLCICGRRVGGRGGWSIVTPSGRSGRAFTLGRRPRGRWPL